MPDPTRAEQDELRRLRTALPRTADGVTVVPGMTVYYVYGTCVRWCELYGWSKTDADGYCSCWYSTGYSSQWQWGKVYSTQSAAEDAAAAPTAK